MDKDCDIVIASYCIGCLKCVTACKKEAIQGQGTTYYIDLNKCIKCGECIPVCPVGAIKELY